MAIDRPIPPRRFGRIEFERPSAYHLPRPPIRGARNVGPNRIAASHRFEVPKAPRKLRWAETSRVSKNPGFQRPVKRAPSPHPAHAARLCWKRLPLPSPAEVVPEYRPQRGRSEITAALANLRAGPAAQRAADGLADRGRVGVTGTRVTRTVAAVDRCGTIMRRIGLAVSVGSLLVSGSRVRAMVPLAGWKLLLVVVVVMVMFVLHHAMVFMIRHYRRRSHGQA